MISRLYTFLFLAFFGGFILLSCNGREKALVSPQESLKQKKLLDSFSENIKYFPEDYAKVITDTTLSNGFRVVIKLQTKMDSNVLVEENQDTIVLKRHYRDFVGNVSVFKDGNLLISEVINKSFINNELKNEEIDLSQYILNNIWISNYFDNSKEKVCLNFDYCKPEVVDACWGFEFFVDKSGKHLLKLFEYN